MNPAVGFVALARPTFDTGLAAGIAESGWRRVVEMADVVSGGPQLCLDLESVAEARGEIGESAALVVLQATFADSTLIEELTRGLRGRVVLWAVPEERTGGRLRLNSLCGINLAAYALARQGAEYSWLYRAPDDPAVDSELREALMGPLPVPPSPESPSHSGSHISLDGSVVGVIGERPDGFEPCDYDPIELRHRFGVTVDRVDLRTWFDRAEGAGQETVEDTRRRLSSEMSGLEDVEQGSLERSLRLHAGLSDLVGRADWSGVATRCWPECFTEFGGAACAGNSLLTTAGRPGCCEADVYGVLTALLLQRLGEDPPFIADLVHLDRESNTAAFWHCGQASARLAGERPRAEVHSNRRKPLLYEFPLRAGRVTIARVSQARGDASLVIGSGEMLDEPLPFSGTSGVARLDSDVDHALGVIMASGVEHHYGIAYGDHAEALEEFAGSTGLGLIRI